MTIEIYADGADFNGILKAAENPLVTGFTTNPTLMRQAGVTDYEEFAHNIISVLAQKRPGTNISLEVFADDTNSMYEQAKKIASWGEFYKYDVFVKIPVTNTKGEPNYGLIRLLNEEGVKVNVTAVFTPQQTFKILESINNPEVPVIISIFSGRIADTLRDPVDRTKRCVQEMDCFEENDVKNVKFLWASCRELYHLRMAEHSGCNIITMLHDQIKKLSLENKDLEEFSQETVQMFYNDAVASGYRIEV
jgi:transaldolase